LQLPPDTGARAVTPLFHTADFGVLNPPNDDDIPAISGAYSTVITQLVMIQLEDLTVCASQLAKKAACGPGDSGHSGGGARGGAAARPQARSNQEPESKPESDRARVPSESESTEESDRVRTQESESTGESDRVWTQEPESTEESDFFFTQEPESTGESDSVGPKSPIGLKSPDPKKIGLCVLPWLLLAWLCGLERSSMVCHACKLVVLWS
jgi:hypothetical protein